MYFESFDARDLKNKLRRTLSSNCALHKLRNFYHSWMWSNMCITFYCYKWVRISRRDSWWTKSCNNVRNIVASELKLPCDAEGWSIYHFIVGPVRVHWNNCNWIVSSMILLDEHHRWKVMTWFPGSCPCFPSNFGMLNGAWWAWVANSGRVQLIH